MTEADFLKLLDGFKKQTLSAQELNDFLDASQLPAFEQLLGNALENDLKVRWVDGLAAADTGQKLWQQLDDTSREPAPTPSRIYPLRQWRSVAAILVFILSSTAAYLLFIKEDHKKDVATVNHYNSTDSLRGIGKKAILTIANEKQIILDSTATGVISKQGNTIINNTNSQLIYQNNGTGNTTINKIETPIGGQYSIVLSDGTKAWLNAGSSLTFPASFTGKERKVEMTGEVYFEVAQNASQPFKVAVNNSTWIDVLGTSFNVNAYKEEGSIKTTLLQGAVLMNTHDHSKRLTPGQQARINNNDSKIELIDQVNQDQVMGWKNGYFTFERAPVESIMNQFQRWYNIEVIYRGTKPTDLFTGSIPLSSSLPQALKILEYARVHYVLEDNKVIILSSSR